MEMHDEPSEAPVRAAASVVMLRDGASGLEVFLLKRHGLSDVLGGAYVFPGGKVDTADAEPGLHQHLDMPLQLLHESLHEPQLSAAEAASLYVAALREAFEETGVLYAEHAGAQEAQRAWSLHREGHAFDEVLGLLSLNLLASRLQPWSRWITPRVRAVIRKRFDTRFFVAAVPGEQEARHDNHEATASVWLSPRAALEQYRDGLIELAPPQIMSLSHLARHGSVQSVMSQARLRAPPLVEPQPFERDGQRMICYPGDEGHSVRERAFPGPTRLRYREGRFEPEGGFESFFTDTPLAELQRCASFNGSTS
jgi:8-oxo-dGTP pyrophosphatase MutT (NUDIX family)